MAHIYGRRKPRNVTQKGYRDVLGARVLREGEPTFLRLGNIWLTINRGGGPTDDNA
jgi:hypothetical protein